MKKLKVLLGFLLLFFIQSSILAQVPQKINYQAVARDLAGNPLLSQSVTVDFSIRQSTPSGTIVYTETHNSTTNPFGLFTLEIGGGTPVTGTFGGINWSTGLYYLEVTVNGDVMPASQLLSVPYALHAETATSGSQGPNGHSALADSVAEPAGVNCPNGGYLIHMGADDNDDGILQTLEIDISYYICNGLDGAAGNNNDTSATNELQTLSISNDTIYLTNGGFVVLPSGGVDNDWSVVGNDMSSAPTGNVGIGTAAPISKLSVVSSDSLVSSFIGLNPDVAAITVAGISPNAKVGSIFLTGTDSGIVAIDPASKQFFMANTTPNGHVVLAADSSVSAYGKQIAFSATDILYNQTPRIFNSTDSIFSYSASGTIVQVNQGLFLTDSLYVLGNNAANANWVLANDGAGQAVWTNPASLGGASLWQSNAPDIYFNTGNVGIGTTTPTSPLTFTSINGLDIEFTGGFNADISASADLLLSSFGNTNIDANAINFQTLSTDRMIVASSGNVGIGTISPQQLLTLSAPASTSLRLERSNAAAFDWEMNVDNLGFHLKGGANGTGPSLTDFVNVDGFGKVGLGITTPTQLLHLFGGTLRIDDGTNPYNLPGSDGTANQVMTTDGAGNVSWQTPASASPWTKTGTSIYQTTLTDFVGIGTASPTYNLHVESNTMPVMYIKEITPTNGSSIVLESSRQYHLLSNNSGDFKIQDLTASKARMIIDPTGNVGIGLDNNPLVKLHVADEAQTIVGIQSSHNGAADMAGTVTMVRSRGTIAAPTAVQNGDRLGKLEWVGWNGGTSNFEEKASIRVYADENYIGGSTAAHMEFHVTPFGQSTSIEAMHIANNGFVGLGNGSPSSLLHLTGGTMTIDNGANPYTLPTADGTANQVMVTDGSGNLSWQTPGGAALWSQGTGGVHPSTLTDAVWIGTSNPIPGANLHIAKEGGLNAVFMETFGGSDSKIILSQANGTMSTPTKSITGSTLGVIEFDGHQGGGLGNYTRGADILVTAEQDFSIGQASSMQIRTMDNSAAYDARITIDPDGEVGIGTTAPVNLLHVNGGVTITDGTQGSGKVLTSDATGNATWQTLPTSINFNANTSSTAIPPGITTTILFNNVEYDNGGNYNGATGNFMAPETGIYHVDATVTFDAGASNHEIQIQILRNGGTYKTVTLYNDFSNNFTTAHISGDIYLPVNNTVSIGIYQNSGGTIVPTSTTANSKVYFNAHLIR